MLVGFLFLGWIWLNLWYLTNGLMTDVTKVGGWLHLPLNPERLRKLTEDYAASNAKIKAALCVDRMPVDAREGLRRTLESFKENRLE